MFCVQNAAGLAGALETSDPTIKDFKSRDFKTQPNSGFEET
jgi:hypothetical protein